MTNQEKLTVVTNKICELLKGSDLDPMELKAGCIIRPYQANCDYQIYMMSSGYFHIFATKQFKCGTKNETVKYPVSSPYDIIGSPIREAEVLAALNRVSKYDCDWMLDGDGYFNYSDQDGGIEYSAKRWQLGKPLSNQPKEVIDFLFNVLNCE